MRRTFSMAGVSPLSKLFSILKHASCGVNCLGGKEEKKGHLLRGGDFVFVFDDDEVDNDDDAD